LTATCISAALVLAGCDAAADANRAAQRAADEAAARALSAGDARATDALMEQVKNAPDIEQLVRDLKSRADKGVLVQNTADKDLTDAISKLKDGIALDPS